MGEDWNARIGLNAFDQALTAARYDEVNIGIKAAK